MLKQQCSGGQPAQSQQATAPSQPTHPVVHVIHLALHRRPTRPPVLGRGLGGGGRGGLLLTLLRLDRERHHHCGKLVAKAVEAVVLSICGNGGR